MNKSFVPNQQIVPILTIRCYHGLQIVPTINSNSLLLIVTNCLVQTIQIITIVVIIIIIIIIIIINVIVIIIITIIIIVVIIIIIIIIIKNLSVVEE